MCLGTMMFGRRCDEAEAGRIVAASLERGVDNIDTAAAYADGVTEEILPQALAEGIAITAYQPLMGGVLAGRYQPGQPPPPGTRGAGEQRIVDRLATAGERVTRFNKLAAELALKPGQLAIAWVNHSP